MKERKDFLKIPMSRIIILVILDIISVLVASFASLYIRFDFSIQNIDGIYLQRWEAVLPWIIILAIVINYVWRLYKSVWRYASATELLNIIGATTTTAAVQLVWCTVTENVMPKSYYLLFWFLATCCICCIRFSYRILRLINAKKRALGHKNSVNVMLVGAGAAGNAIIKEVESSEWINLNIKCIIDDAPGCHGKYMRGIPIVGGRDKIMDAVNQYAIDEIIMAVPSVSNQVSRATG